MTAFLLMLTLAMPATDVAVMGSEALMAPLADPVLELEVAYLDSAELLGVLGPDNAMVLTPMDDFRRLVRSNE